MIGATFIGFIVCAGALVTAVPLDKNSSLTCQEYETCTDCINPCTPSCAIPYPRECEFLVCNEGCLCNAGFKKSGGYLSDCVAESACQSYCKPYQIYNECGSACPPTCQNREPKCDEVCTAGCFCKEGYIFDEVFELCVSTCPW